MTKKVQDFLLRTVDKLFLSVSTVGLNTFCFSAMWNIECFLRLMSFTFGSSLVSRELFQSVPIRMVVRSFHMCLAILFPVLLVLVCIDDNMNPSDQYDRAILENEWY
jgi:hypothetical protein